MVEAYKKIKEKRAWDNVKANKTVSDLKTEDEDINGKA